MRASLGGWLASGGRSRDLGGAKCLAERVATERPSGAGGGEDEPCVVAQATRLIEYG